MEPFLAIHPAEPHRLPFFEVLLLIQSIRHLSISPTATEAPGKV